MGISQLPLWKKVIFYGIALLAGIGVFDAFHNLPIASNCAFYADCAVDGGSGDSG